ncbi:MAG: transporter substrate-binding domain-containing protein [Sulfitobacter sp.]
MGYFVLRFLIVLIAASFGVASPATAQDCGGIYQVKSGDSLSYIANRLYQDARKWTVIYSSNLTQIGQDPDKILVGTNLSLTCISGLPTGLSQGQGVAENQPATEAPQTSARAPQRLTPRAFEGQINLLTGSDFVPFTDAGLDQGGLLADLVNTAMQAVTPADGFQIHWVNDWAAHHDPLMKLGMMDMAFPWYKPDCGADPQNNICANFLFSDPMFETLTLLFTDKSRPVPFATDQDLVGRILCRPKGHITHDLNRVDRRWITDAKVELISPELVSECFEMLIAGQVDAVAINEFTGRAAVKDLQLSDSVEVVQRRPLSIEGLHVLVHKQHPDAQALLDHINSGLRAIKDNGQYQAIVDRHMSNIWAGF